MAGAAEGPGRHLESRRALAPVVYLATVVSVGEEGQKDEPAAMVRTMRAALKVDRVLRSGAFASPPAETVVRYRVAGPGDKDLPAELFHKLAAGDRVVVFAPSFEPSFAIEMIAGSARTVSAQAAALRDALAGMDETAARLHGVTPAVRARQTELYGRIVAELRGLSAP